MNKTNFVVAFLILAIACSQNNRQTFLEVTGTIEATEITLSAKVAGEIIAAPKDEGSPVKVGDTILLIDKTNFELQLEQAAAAEDIARANLNLLLKGARKEDIKSAEEMLRQAEESYILAKSNYERFSNLNKTSSVSLKQLEDAEYQLKIAESKFTTEKENLNKLKSFFRPEEIEQAKANLRKATSQVQLLKKYISDSYVVSPIDGIIIEKFVEFAENVFPGTPLVKISNLNKVEMRVYVPEIELGKVKLGQKVEVNTDTYPNKKYFGKVTYISSEAEFTPKNIQTKDERTKLVFEVKIEMSNENHELKPGMPADAKIILQ